MGNTWEIKRDRWNGYQAEMYKDVVDEFNTYEEVRKKVKKDEEIEEGRKEEDPLNAAKLVHK